MIVEPTRKIILTGDKGCGKTTVIREVIELLKIQGVGTRGFYTEPTNASASGYAVVSLNGIRVTIAHVELKRGPRVGPFRVDVQAFEEAILPQLVISSSDKSANLEYVVVIDEIGRFQCLSDRFLDQVSKLFESPSWLLASVELDGGPFVQFMHSWARDRVIRVTESNRDKLPDRIVDALLLA